MNRIAWCLVLIAFLILPAGCGQDDDTSSNSSSDKAAGDSATKDDIEPLADAYHRPGPIGDGRFVLPNGRMVKPAGDYIDTPSFPIDVAVSPDGATVVFNTAYISRSFKPSINIYDTALGQVTQVFSRADGINHTFAGAIFNAAGDRFYVAGGADHSILEFSLVAGYAEKLQRIPVQGFPCNIKLSADEQYLFAVLHMSKRLVKIRISDGKEMKSYPAHLFAYDVAISEDESVAWVSNQGVDTVSAINLNSAEELETIDVGQNPEGVALSPDGKTLYVANSDSDSISVIDTATYTLTDTWNLHNDKEDVFAYGAFPVDIEVLPDGSRLLVTCAGYDSVDVIDADTGDVVGRIPTGWYPQNSIYDPVEEKIYIVSGKGVGSHGTVRVANWPGLFQALDMPSDQELATYTEDSEEGIRWASNFYTEWTEAKGESPIPTEWGERSEQIRHVVFILKENKTYDQILGDLEGAEGDTQYTQFGEAITPNHHTLARRFVNCDNLYVEGDTSAVGHLWASYASVNDHMEKAFFAGLYPIPDVEPGSQPAGGPFFAKVLDNGLEFRSYGQIVGLSQDLDRFAPYIDLHYGFWNMGTSDENEKAEEIIREWEKGMFPDFIYIVLPNDHNYGSDEGAPTPRYLVGDNDAGLGKLVDWISHSEYWDETAIFVTEDDPQAGSDHIDPHRTIGLVISPWAKKGHTSSVLYSMSSIWLTIDLILGLPPSSKFDQFASPMYDAFTMEKESTPYNYIPNPIPFEVNGEDKYSHLFCGTPNFLVPDGAPGTARVLWAMYKPGVPFPYADSVDACNLEDEEEEAEEIAEYVQAVNKAVAYGKARGIKVPVPDGWWELSATIEAKQAEHK